jgi:hypothetical protein
MSEKKAAAPAEDVTAESVVPPADDAGAAEGTGVPAGSPVIEVEPGEAPPDAVFLKVAPPHEALEVLGAEAVGEYRPFTQAQAAALRDAAGPSGVTLIDKSEEEASGPASV